MKKKTNKEELQRELIHLYNLSNIESQCLQDADTPELLKEHTKQIKYYQEEIEFISRRLIDISIEEAKQRIRRTSK